MVHTGVSPTHTSNAVPPFILTLDIGTSSLRARLYDGQGRDLPALDVQAAYRLQTTPDGGAVLDPQHLLEVTVQAIDALLWEAGSLAEQIGAVAVSTLAYNLLGIDAQGRPLTPLYTYADTRPQLAAQELRRRLNEAAVFERTGCPLRISYAHALLLWLRQTEPELCRHVTHWLSFGDYLLFQLFGTLVTSQSLAAWSGLLNRQRSIWDAELLEALVINVHQLPPIARDGQSLKGLRRQWAERWPALAQVPWFPAIGDGACSNAGSGCMGPDRAALAVGTSGALRLLLEEPVAQVPWGLWAYRVTTQRTLVGGALNNGGSLFGWLRRTLAAGSVEQIERAVMALEPDAHGLTVLPFLAGDRSPIWRADARAAIVGLSLDTQPAEIIRAGMEAVAYRFALLHRLLAEVAGSQLTIIASGGAITRSSIWPQIMADVLGCPVVVSAQAEATSRGAALLVLESLGMLTRPAALPVSAAATYHPDPQCHIIYQRGLERHLKLYEQLVGTAET